MNEKVKKWLKIILVVVVIILLYEFIHGVYRQYTRLSIFKKAKERSRLLNKRLVVVGDPYYGHGSRFYSSFMPNYDCGDVTVDLTGSPKCPNGVKSDLLKYLQKEPDDSAVLFISCVLEYVPDIQETISEIKRVAGNLENVFVVTVNEWSFTAYFYKDDYSSSRQLIYAPPEYSNLTYKTIS